jgi:hypothetical protein
MADPITDYYADNPVEVLDKNQRVWYDPDVMLLFKQRALFSNVINFTKNLGDPRATSMVTTQVIPPHANYSALSTRQMWLPAMHIDSRAVEITFLHYGGKVALHDYDDLVTYWKANANAGLRSILNTMLGGHIIETTDYLARNAFVKGALATTGYVMYGGDATSFNDLDSLDKFDLDIAADIQLGMQYRECALVNNPLGGGANGAAGNVLCYTTPGVIFDIQDDENFVDVRKYQDLTSILKYEVGAYKGVRFIQSPRLTLWNAGAVIFQSAIKVALHAGDGAPAPATKVDGVYGVGQESAGIVHTVTVADTPTDIAVNDIITLHLTRTSTYGVTNGVDPFEGTSQVRRVVAKNDGAKTLQLDKPVMIDYATDLGSTVYGYVTKGVNVHSSIFVGGPQGIVAGLAQPIRMHTPPPIDDMEAIYRYSWNVRMGYQPYDPEVFEVTFTSGSVRYKGSRKN